MTALAAEHRETPFDRFGGEPAVRRLVDRFYDLMEVDPAYMALRAMHAEDLTAMRESLTLFLTAWMGGPRTWFDERPGACIMSLHRSLAVSRLTAGQWLDAMRRALDDSGAEPALVDQIDQAFTCMAGAMAAG